MRTRTQLASISIWIARLVWALLPITSGIAAADVLDDWSTAPGSVAAAYLWIAWAIGLVALLAPRPIGITTLRAIAPTFLALAIVVAFGDAATPAARFAALIATVLALAFVLTPAVSVASADGAAYGDERRFPLKVPPALFLGPLLVAPLVIAAGIASGPLLLADGRFVLGAIALVGIPLGVLAARSLHTLAQRFAVLVPAGLAIVDPFTLSDPVLFPRERIASLRPADPRIRPPEGALDARLGANGGTLAVSLDKSTDALQIRRGRRGSETVRIDELWFAAVGSRDLVEIAGERKIRTR